MPEYPDVVHYVSALERLLAGQRLDQILVKSPFVIRTFDPPIEACQNQVISGFSRYGKRIGWHLGNQLNLIFHLMIAGRYHWRKPGAVPRGKNDLIAFQFVHGTMMLTEASSKKRASLHIVPNELLPQFESDAVEIFECSIDQFHNALTGRNRTLKRALTDPRSISGIGNAYSDEILLVAKISPFVHTRKLNEGEIQRLFQACKDVLGEWVDRLEQQTGDRFPEKVTAFRKEMLVHGKFGEPCYFCKAPIQRVVYADNEMNYCPRCQTGGKILADRSLSRLLKDDWPKTIDEMLDDEG